MYKNGEIQFSRCSNHLREKIYHPFFGLKQYKRVKDQGKKIKKLSFLTQIYFFPN